MKNLTDSSSAPTDICFYLKIISVYLLLLFILSVIFNSTLLFVFIKNKSLRSPLNILIIFLTILNLIGTFIELPIVTINSYNCKWSFGNHVCVISAYVMYFVGCTSIYLMTCISFERYYIINEPFFVRKINYKIYVIVIALCCIGGLTWATLPLLGWSHYALEGAQIGCSVEWNDSSFSVISYNITILLLVFALPLFTILLTNLKLIYLIIKLRKRYESSYGNFKFKKRIAVERKVTFIVIVLIGGFIVTWVPYAIVCIYSAFIDKVEPLMATLPSMFAKTSLLWTSMFYILTNKQIREKLFIIKNNQKKVEKNGIDVQFSLGEQYRSESVEAGKKSSMNEKNVSNKLLKIVEASSRN